MIYAQNLYRFAIVPIRHDIGRLRNDEFTGTGHAAGTADMRVVGRQVFDIVKDAEGDPPSTGGTLLSDIGSQRNQVFQGL